VVKEGRKSSILEPSESHRDTIANIWLTEEAPKYRGVVDRNLNKASELEMAEVTEE
jgi:hypothetical protein